MRSKRGTYELSYASFKDTYGCMNATDRHHSKGNIQEQNTAPKRSLPTIGITGTDGVCQGKIECENEVKNNNSERNQSFDGVSLSSSNESSCSNAQKTNSPNLTPAKRHRLRKVSMETLSSVGDSAKAAVVHRRAKAASVPEQEAKSEKRLSSFLSNIQPYFSRKLALDTSSTSTEEGEKNSGGISGKNPKPAVFSIPASRQTTCAHRGYLDFKNKKKQWERYWCRLQDACLFCYHTPQSESTHDVILLRGYDVIADVTNLNRSRFTFRLQQKGVPALHFSTKNHRDFMFWVGTLERETQSANSPSAIKSHSFCEDSSNSKMLLKLPSTTQHRASLPDIGTSGLTPETQQTLKRSASQEHLDQKLMEIEKHKLLKEMATNKQQIVEEQEILDRIKNSPLVDRSSQARRASREKILDQYEEEKVQEELRNTKFLTFLNCRRNSAHIKMAQYSKDLAPKNGQRRCENHAHFSAMEKKLKDMQVALVKIDREIAEEEATKQHNLEKLQRRRDLELLIVEQQDVVNILRRNRCKGVIDDDRRHSSYDAIASSSPNSYDALTSIDELSCTSDGYDSSSVTDSLAERTAGDVNRSAVGKKNDKPTYRRRRHSVGDVLNPEVPRSDCLYRRKFSTEDALCSNGDNDLQFFVDRKEKDAFKTSDESLYSTGNSASDGRTVSCGSDESILAVRSRDSTLKSKSTSNTFSDIDSSVLAKIEDFELFAKLKLEEQKVPSSKNS